MKLSIDNFAKIKKAEIIIDGITIIAGENNTGKSTIGKILFSIFNSLFFLEKKIEIERAKTVRLAIDRSISQILFDKEKAYFYLFMEEHVSYRKNVDTVTKFIYELTQSLTQIDDDIEIKLRAFFKQTSPFKEASKRKMEKAAKQIAGIVNDVIAMPVSRLAEEMVTKYFKNVFSDQINSLITKNSKSEITLKIKENLERMIFYDNRCTEYEPNIKISHKAIYIDNPFILDKLSSHEEFSFSPIEEELIKLLVQDTVLYNNEESTMIESVWIKEKLSAIYETLQTVVSGDIVYKESDGAYYLKNNSFNEPVSFQNLSAGLKSFVILKMLLENGDLKEKDVVILDEPEIHLHPQWQIAYAELIVLLQKEFDLSIVVTTHSPYFVDALDLFSRKHKTDNRVNYYLSDFTDEGVTFDWVNDDINLIYEKMASPINLLETLRYELNND